MPDTLMDMIGDEIAKMHLADVVHGDLTTSNMMLRHPTSFTALSPDNPRTQLVSLRTHVLTNNAMFTRFARPSVFRSSSTSASRIPRP